MKDGENKVIIKDTLCVRMISAEMQLMEIVRKPHFGGNQMDHVYITRRELEQILESIKEGGDENRPAQNQKQL
jgi:hypothetical protein